MAKTLIPTECISGVVPLCGEDGRFVCTVYKSTREAGSDLFLFRVVDADAVTEQDCKQAIETCDGTWVGEKYGKWRNLNGDPCDGLIEEHRVKNPLVDSPTYRRIVDGSYALARKLREEIAAAAP